MFEAIFSCPITITACRTAPLVDDRQHYLTHCIDHGAKRGTLRQVVRTQLHLVDCLDLQIGECVSLDQIESAARSPVKPVGYHTKRLNSARMIKAFIHQAIRWLRFIDRYEEPNTLHHSQVAEITAFAQWMRCERGLAESTIKGRCGVIHRLFEWWHECGVTLATLQITDIDQALARYQVTGQYRRSTINLYAQIMCAFFHFAEHQDWCKAGLADSILPPRFLRDDPIPKGLTREEVMKLLATTEGKSPTDLRDRAILMLLITYGLRSGEVCGLQLDDLSWQENMLRVHCPKSGRTLYHPLSRSVGESIITYLCEVRPPSSQRALFLTLMFPIGAIKSRAVNALMRRRMKKIGITRKRTGPHSLRFSAAQHLLEQGLSMKQIGDYLGHRSTNTTAVYAKVNLNALRGVAEVDWEGLI